MNKRIVSILFGLIAGGVMAHALTIDFESGEKKNYTFLNPAYASLTTEGALSGKQSLKLDTRASSSVWNGSFATAEGVLKADTDYVIRFTCKLLSAEKDSYVHAIVRPLDVSDHTMDVGRFDVVDIGVVKHVKLKFRTKKDKDTYALQLHPKNKTVALIDDIVIIEGTGEEFTAATAGAKPYSGPVEVATGSAAFTIDLPMPAKQTAASVADFGASTDSPDNVNAFNDAIAHCASNGVGKLVVPKGVYRFTNNNPVKFSKMTDFEFDGQGSEFIWLKTRGSLIEVKECERILFRNFFIDWDWAQDPIGSIIKVTAVATDGASIDAEFPDLTKFPRRDMRIAILEALDPATMSVGHENGYSIGFEFYKGRADTPPAKYEWLSDNSFRLFATDSGKKARFANDVKPGKLFRVRHYVYDMVGLVMSDNKHLTLSNVTVYSCPSHAFLSSGEQHHWQMLKTRIIPRPGTKRPVTCSADHHHIARSKGYLLMDGCEFSFGGDDCLNVHDTTGFAFKSGEKTLTTKNMDPGLLREGDLAEFRNDDYSPTGYTGKFIKRTGENKGRNGVYELTFEDPVPEQKGTGFILFNKRYGSRNIIVRNSYFHDNKARGLLLLANDITIESNRFFHNEAGAIKIETGYTFNVWSEGYGASNIVIRNNVFENVNPIGAFVNEKQPVIYMSVYLKSDPSVEKTMFPVLNTILVEKNSFINNPGVIAYVCSAGNVVIRDNTIRNIVPRNENMPYRGAVGTSHASGVTVINNTWVRSPYMNPGLYSETDTTKDIVFEGNSIVDK
ncbi:MAG: right-handed parallel beta-helix repeat-containing protein [Spirochaetes bacterium]|nr:right-handed parallel beta-helix repeat-containing protein [Spirochaetota bacterium]